MANFSFSAVGSLFSDSLLESQHQPDADNGEQGGADKKEGYDSRHLRSLRSLTPPGQPLKVPS